MRTGELYKIQGLIFNKLFSGRASAGKPPALLVRWFSWGMGVLEVSAGLVILGRRMIGTILNVGTIVGGGVVGLTVGRELSPAAQWRIKMILGVVTIYVGITTTWGAIGGSFVSVLKQITIAMAALVLGNLIGKGLRLQKQLNKLGDYAKQRFSADPEKPNQFAEGLTTCTILFCVGPMAIVGALQDGLHGNFKLLAIKSAMDGLATVAFVKTFGWGVILAAIPVLAYQGTITLGAHALQTYLQNQAMLDSVNAVGGLLILCISTVILDIARVPLADYLPSLAVAPVLTWLFR